MAITDFTFDSRYQVDKILEVFSGSFNSASRVNPIPINSSNITGISDLVYYAGTYTVDGSNPQDIGSVFRVNNFNFQVLASSQSNVINLLSNNADTVSHSVTYEITVISKPTNTFFTPSGSVDPANSLYFTTGLNYQKVAFDDVLPVSVAAAVGTIPTDTLVAIPHNLGYKPCVRAFVDNGTTLTDVLVRNGIALIYNINLIMTNSVDENNVYFRFTNEDTTSRSFNLNYRIYYDAN